MKEVEKSIASKTEVNNALGLRDKNREKKQQRLDSSYFRGKSHFEDDRMQSYLVSTSL